MKHRLLSLLAFMFCASAEAQYTYEWDTSSDLSAHGVYCQIQKTKTYYEVPVSCSQIIPDSVFSIIIENAVITYDSTEEYIQPFPPASTQTYKLSIVNTKKVAAAATTFDVHTFLYEPVKGGPAYYILYQPGLGILAKKLALDYGVNHPWCFLKNKRVMTSNHYFMLSLLLVEVRKAGFK